MGMGMLFAGALTGAGNALGSMADDAIKREDEQRKYQMAVQERRDALLYEMEMKEKFARRVEQADAQSYERAVDAGQQRGDDRRFAKFSADMAQSGYGEGMDEAQKRAIFEQHYNDKVVSDEVGGARYYEPESADKADILAEMRRGGASGAAIKTAREDYTTQLKAEQSSAEAVRKERSERAREDLRNRQLDQQWAISEANRAAAETRSSKDKPPAGYRPTASGNLEAIPGGPADQKIQGAFNADTAQLTGAIAGFDRLAGATNQLLNHPGLASITGLRGKLPNIPGGDAADAQALLETLKSQVGFGVLQDMRNSSKTGGALGSVSDAEGKRLEANLAALDKAQSLEQFQKSLGQILDYTEQAKDRMRGAFNMKHSERQPAPANAGFHKVNSLEEAMALPSGTAFIAPNGKLKVRP